MWYKNGWWTGPHLRGKLQKNTALDLRLNGDLLIKHCSETSIWFGGFKYTLCACGKPQISDGFISGKPLGMDLEDVPFTSKFQLKKHGTDVQVPRSQRIWRKNSCKLPVVSVFEGQRSRLSVDIPRIQQMSLRFVDEVRYSQQSCCNSIQLWVVWDATKNMGDLRWNMGSIWEKWWCTGDKKWGFLWFPESWGYPRLSSILDWDFPWNLPSFEMGTSMTQENPIFS